jgi:hypothetical protein
MFSRRAHALTAVAAHSKHPERRGGAWLLHGRRPRLCSGVIVTHGASAMRATRRPTPGTPSQLSLRINRVIKGFAQLSSITVRAWHSRLLVRPAVRRIPATVASAHRPTDASLKTPLVGSATSTVHAIVQLSPPHGCVAWPSTSSSSYILLSWPFALGPMSHPLAGSYAGLLSEKRHGPA